MQEINRIFPLNSKWLEREQHSKPLTSKPLGCFLLLGDKNLHKLSLLFQASVTCGYEKRQVVFICNEVLKTLPLHVHGMPEPDSEVMTHLKFLYMSKLEELIAYLADIHTTAQLPDIIVISDLCYFASQCQGDKLQHSLVRLCAILSDSITYLATKSRGRCQVYLSSTDTNNNHEDIYRRYFKNIFHVKRLSPDISQVIPISSGNDEANWRLTYSCLNETLRLEEYFVSEKNVAKTETVHY